MVGPSRQSGPREHAHIAEDHLCCRSRKRPGRPGRAGNAVISERVKKCDRIKAPFASGGPPRRRPTLLVVTTARTGNDATAVGPGRNWFCIFMKALLTETVSAFPWPRLRRHLSRHHPQPPIASLECVKPSRD